VAGAVLLGHLLRLVQAPADDRGHLDPLDPGEGVEVLDAERSGAGECDTHV
jgi:hypothetical protein